MPYHHHQGNTRAAARGQLHTACSAISGCVSRRSCRGHARAAGGKQLRCTLKISAPLTRLHRHDACDWEAVRGRPLCKQAAVELQRLDHLA